MIDVDGKRSSLDINVDIKGSFEESDKYQKIKIFEDAFEKIIEDRLEFVVTDYTSCFVKATGAISQLKGEIDAQGFSKQNWCIMTTGSDARGERSLIPVGNSCQKKGGEGIEIIFFSEKKNDDQQAIVKKINEYIQKNNQLFYYPIEEKYNEKEVENGKPSGTANLLSCAHAGDVYMPMRGLESIFIDGDLQSFKEYKCELYKQLKNNGKNKGEFKKKFLKPQLVELKKNNEIKSERVQLKFNGKYLRSTKSTHLRPVQFFLCDEIIKAVAEGKMGFDDFFNIPSNIDNRLEWLSKRQFVHLENIPIDQVRNAYSTALRFYHESQKRFFEQQQEIVVDAKDYNEMGKVIFEFCKSTSIKVKTPKQTKGSQVKIEKNS